MVETPTPCLDAEVLAAYVDRGLSLAERSRVDRHLASCPQCLALVAGVVRTVADVPEFTPHAGPAVETASRAVTRRTLVGVLAAAAAVLVVLFSPSLVRRGLDRDTGLVSLVGVSEERSVLGRLTGGVPHAPLVMPTAGGQVGTAAQADRIQLTAAKIRESFGERETPARLHELGLTQLLAGRYDEAALALLAASREQPANARYLNDVAAVQLERARLGLRPDDLPRALASADRARRLDPSLNEAWFNRALAATALSLTDQARQAWTEYLARDNSSAWAAEARTRLQELAKPTPADAWAGIARQLDGEITVALAETAVRAQMTEARNFIETQLLPAWAAAVEAGRDASRELNGLRNLGDAFASVAGDQLYRDTVAAIDRADGHGANTLRELARAHRNYASAAVLYGEDRFSEAVPGLTSSRAGFIAAASPFADRAALDLSTVLYVGGKANEANTLLNSVSDRASASAYAYNSARAAWVKGLISFGQGRMAEAQSHYEQTLAAFERMGDVELGAAAHGLLAALNDYLGAPDTAWRHRVVAFEGLKWSRSPRFRYSIVASAVPSIRAESPETALSVQDAAVTIAREWKREGAIADSLAQRASILSSLGRADEAARSIREARLVVQQVPDLAFRSRLEVGVLSTESDLSRHSDPGLAVASATRAIELVRRRGDRIRLAQLNLRLAKANIVWGNLVAAEAALANGIRAFDEERALMSDEGRISTLDESWQLFEASTQLSIRKGDYQRAFAMSERARARTLAEAKRVPTNHSLTEVQQSLEPDRAVIALNQFENELAIWVIRRGSAKVTIRPLTRRGANALVARQQAEISLAAHTPFASRDIYNELLRPVAGQLEGATRLVIVPDATYEDTAFAALWDSSRQRFLIEGVSVSLAPSVGAFVTALSRPPTTEKVDAPFVVGGPNHSGDARAVAELYSRPVLLTGTSATRTRLLEGASGHAVVHLSVVTAKNAAYPLLSRVFLADEDGHRHSGNIFGREIASRPMSNTNLVVIDEVEATGANRGDGTVSLARAFMTAGVRTVVGTLPGADEAAVDDLMVGFHRRLASGMPAAEALTDLQRNVLHSNGRRLGAWSALVLYGSDR